MPVAIIVSVLLVAGLLLLWSTLGGSAGGDDVPARIVAVAAGRLPTRLREWGLAMTAELIQIQDRAGRWRFAGGVLRVVLFPPARNGRRALVTALAGLASAAGLTAAAASEVPSLTVFAAALGLLLGSYATVATWRSAWDGWTAGQTVVAAAAAAGMAASVADVVWVAVFHPAAITASTDVPVYSIVLAALLATFLAAALSLPRGRHGRAVLRWGLGGTLASGAVYVAVAVSGAGAPLYLAGLAATLGVAAWASARAGSRTAGIRAGLLMAALSAPVRFAVDITTLLRVHRYTLADWYDIAAFPHSGYPDVASYLLSDALGGAILSSMLIYSVLAVAATLLGAAGGQSGPGPISMAPQGHPAAHRPQPLQ